MQAAIDSPEPQPSSKKRKVKDSPEPQPSSPKDSYPLDMYILNLAEKFKEGNKSRGSDEQERSAKGTFGQKSIWDCSWRTWIKRMYNEHPGVICTCSCNRRPISTGEALIQHIQRKHYVDSVVSFGDEYLNVE